MELYRRILTEEGGLTPEQAEKQVAFREMVVRENEIQNLTRIVDPREFFEGHFRDAQELAQTGWLAGRVMDLGSGGGVPGLPCALLDENHWILAESENKKADFLRRAAEGLGLTARIEVFSGRAEAYLKQRAVNGIVARAVGPVSRIFSWIEGCSTWNTLILLKSRGWKEEWSSPESRKVRARLELKGEHEYSVGADAKYRVIVRLERKK